MKRAALFALALVSSMALADDAIVIGGGGSSNSISPQSGDAVRSSRAATADDGLTFEDTPDTSGVSLLPDTSFVGMNLELSCRESQISGTQLVCTGGTFNEAGAGSSPTANVTTPFFDGTQAFAFNTGKYYDGPAGPGQIGTEDFAVEIVFRTPTTATQDLIGTRAGGSSTSTGWKLQITTAGTLTWQIDTSATTQVSLNPCTSISAGAWEHAICYVDRDSATGQSCICNGAQGATTNPTAHDGTSLNETPSRTMDIGAAGDGVNSTNAQIAIVNVWRCPVDDCIDGTLANAAKARAAMVWGVSPETADGGGTPNTMTRGSIAYVDVRNAGTGKRDLFLVGPHAMRLGSRFDGTQNRTGFLTEPSTTNLALQSETIDNASWSKTNVAVTADAVTAPNGFTTGDAIIGSAVGGAHFVAQNVTLSAAVHTWSAWVKAGTGTGNKAVLLSEAVASNGACFKLSDCTKIANFAASTPTETFAESWGDGWCRVGFSWTATAVSTGLRIFASDDLDSCASNDENYAGDAATTDIYVWGAEVEAFPTMTSYQTTTTASATRSADDVRFVAIDNATPSGTMAVSWLCPSYNHTATPDFMVVGSGALDFNSLRSEPTSDMAQANSVVGGATQWSVSAAASDATDGLHHELRVAYDTNDVTVWYDGVSVGTDTSATMQAIDGSDTARLGQNVSGANQPACLITRARIWNRKVAP
jgi:hypothetical protein